MLRSIDHFIGGSTFASGERQGEVFDPNQGEVQAQVRFGTAADLSRYAAAWLSLEAPFAPAPWLAEAVTDRSRGHGPARGLLWRLRDDGDWPIGDGVSARAFGHTGFTGTSIVVDPEAGWTCVLLTNRVHPRRGEAMPVALLRRSVHELVARTFGG